MTAKLLAVSLVCCTYEGAVRKWGLHGSSAVTQAAAYFTKDVFWILAAITASASRQTMPGLLSLRRAFYCGVGLIILGVMVNPLNVALVGGVLSAKALIAMPILSCVIACGLRPPRDITFLAVVIGGLCCSVAMLGAVQFYLPASHVLNQQISSDLHSILQRGHVRASGSFCFISGMAYLAIIGTWSGCSVVTRGKQMAIVGFVFIVAGLVCAASAFSRTGLFSSLFVIAGGIVSSRKGAMLAVGLGLVVFAIAPILSIEGVGEGEVGLITGTFQRHYASDSFFQRAEIHVSNAYFAIQNAPLGMGLGQAQSFEIKRAQNLGLATQTAGFEMEYARIVVEVGICALVGVVIIRLALLRLILQVLLRGRAAHQDEFPGLPALSLITLVLFFASNLVFDHVANCYAWTIATVTLAVLKSGTTPTFSPGMVRSNRVARRHAPAAEIREQTLTPPAEANERRQDLHD